ncbi:hypothetical protein DITRI_Ditri08aG0030300 [Diplodiscus trichospermus]
MDSKGVVEQWKPESMNSNCVDISEFGSIVMQCKRLLATNENSYVSFAPRQAKKIVHALARKSRFHASPSKWFSPPINIVSLLSKTCMELNH